MGLSLAEYARYSPLLYFPLCFLYTRPVAAIRRWSLGVQEQKILGACYIIETPDGQEYFGGSQAGGLAFLIIE